MSSSQNTGRLVHVAMAQENDTLEGSGSSSGPAGHGTDMHLPLEAGSGDHESNGSPGEEREWTNPSAHSATGDSLHAQTAQLRDARVLAEFEQTLLIVLTLNVIYMYYIDHKLIILLIRVFQAIRLMLFPHSSQASQRATAFLLLLSNVPVLLVHKMLFTGSNVESNIGHMLFINFVGSEPKSLLKTLSVDAIIVISQALLLQCKCDLEAQSFHLLTALPVPISENLTSANAPAQTPDESQRFNSAEENESTPNSGA